MTWTPPERPEWVSAVNAGQVIPIADEAARPLGRDELIGEARARLGLPGAGSADLGCPGFDAEALIEALDRVLAALEGEAELHLIGRWMTRRFLLRLLEVRLQLMAWVRSDPGVLDEPIQTPLFVAGAPRTGTTILHRLLAADPRHRAPLGWELLRPVPPPDPDEQRDTEDPRVALAESELALPQTVVSGLRSIHTYGALRPKECLSAMSFAFLSEEFTARYHVPSYADWLARADMTPAYEMHRLVLQVLQRRSGKPRWALKSPVHLHSLQTLFHIYPDARVAVTHRDPLALLASLTSLIAALRWAHSDSVDYAAIADAHARRYRATLSRLAELTRTAALPEAQMHHSRRADFARDAMGTIARLYEHFGLRLDEAVQRSMRDALATQPESERGGHEYAFEDLGLDRDAERAHFQGYRECFGVPEGL